MPMAEMSECTGFAGCMTLYEMPPGGWMVPTGYAFDAAI
jgi:hypothetical protein